MSDPEPQAPNFDPASPSTAAAWQKYSQDMIDWQQRKIAEASQVQTPGQAPAQSWFSNLNPFKGGKSRRSKRSRKSKRTRRR